MKEFKGTKYMIIGKGFSINYDGEQEIIINPDGEEENNEDNPKIEYFKILIYDIND